MRMVSSIVAIPVSDVACAPFVFGNISDLIRPFLPCVEESTVRFGVDFAAIDNETLCDCRFHLGNGSGGFWVDIRRGAQAPEHVNDHVIPSSLSTQPSPVPKQITCQTSADGPVGPATHMIKAPLSMPRFDISKKSL